MKLWARVLLVAFTCLVVLLLWPYTTRTVKECWKNKYKDYVLVIYFNQPTYKNKEVYSKLYDRVFGKVLFCGPEPDARSGHFKADIEVEPLPTEDGETVLGYQCMVTAIDKYPNFLGYIFMSDDLLLNWWTVKDLDFTKLWNMQRNEKDDKEIERGTIVRSCSDYGDALERFSNVNNDVFNGVRLHKTFQSNRHLACNVMPWNFFYVPKYWASSFRVLAHMAYINNIPGNVALNLIFHSFGQREKFETVNVTYTKAYYKAKLDKVFWYSYDKKFSLMYPLKINDDNKETSRYNIEKLDDIMFPIVTKLTQC